MSTLQEMAQAIERRVAQKQQSREMRRAKFQADHALVQFGSGTGPGNHVPCTVVGKEETGKLIVQVVGCEPHEVKARLAGKVVVRTREGEKWQWVPGTVHLVDDCQECRARRGR